MSEVFQFPKVILRTRKGKVVSVEVDENPIRASSVDVRLKGPSSYATVVFEVVTDRLEIIAEGE